MASHPRHRPITSGVPCYHHRGSLWRDNQDGGPCCLIQKCSRTVGHCLTRMLPRPRHFGNRRPIGGSDCHPNDPAAWGAGRGLACLGGTDAANV
jgi:hypothetical protein